MADSSKVSPVRPAEWVGSHRSPFLVYRDIRDLLVVQHPWEPSCRGRFGEWRAETGVPADWRPGVPLFISFYQSDNYCGVWHESEWMGTQAFVGHRFKQLLVNGQVVWEEDVADEELVDAAEQAAAAGEPNAGYGDPYRVVRVDPGTSGKMTLVFRVIDKVPSTKAMPGDAYRRFWWSACDPQEARKNFQTTVYFGDIHVTTDGSIVRPRRAMPGALELRRAGRRSATNAGVPLSLVCPGDIPSPGFPVRCGVPLPEGRYARGTSFGLKDCRGAAVPAIVTETSHWPDGTVRWVLCEFVATRQGRYRFVAGARPAQPRCPVRVRKVRDTIRVSNGVLELQSDGGKGTGIWKSVVSKTGSRLGAMGLSVKMNRVGWRNHFVGQRVSAEVERVNPICAVLRVEGDMAGEKAGRFGPWRARVHVWAGLPYLFVDWRLVNESDQSMAMLLDWSAQVDLPRLESAIVDFGPFEPGHDPDDIGVKAMGHYTRLESPRAIPLHSHSELRCVQEREDQARIYRNTAWGATVKQAAGFVNVGHSLGGLAASMRWFAEEYPKGLVIRPEYLRLGTLPEAEGALGWPHDRPWVRMGRGEAKTQSFALWLHNGRLPAAEAERFNRCVQDPPRLFDCNGFISAGVLETGPARNHPKLEAWAKSVAPVIERTGIKAPRLGHREYWDTCWSNDYRGRAHLGLIQYFETGDPRWYRYFDAACTHTRDIDAIHYCPEHPDWVGTTHQYGEDHTSCGPGHNISLNCDSLLDHYLMTGDPSSLEATSRLAEQILKCSPWSRSARAVGWPLAQAVRWYEQSGDERFLRKAEAFVQAAKAYVEARRGVFAEVHGCWNYRGNVPFMVGYLAFGLIRYHQLTKDPEVLRLLVGLVEGIFAECRARWGRFIYSPFPENNLPAGCHRAWNGLIGGLAGYVACTTGDDRCRAWAQECYDAIVEKEKDLQVSMDMLQIGGWLLHAVAGWGTRTSG